MDIFWNCALQTQFYSSSRLCFLKLTVDWVPVFIWIMGSSQVVVLGESERVHAKTKFWCKLNPGTLLTFLLHNHLLESP